MGQVHQVSVAGSHCLAVTTQTDDGWRAAGFVDLRPIVVESLATEDEAVWAWQFAALDIRLQQEAI